LPRAGDPDEWVYRRKRDRPGEPANIVSAAYNWVVNDFDDTVVPFKAADVAGCVRTWHGTLPAELCAARSAFGRRSMKMLPSPR
jgi:hypothetical protein